MVALMPAPPSAGFPTPRTRLIGREAERQTARPFLVDDAVPLLTLTGPGGVGKTRLALAIAIDVGNRFADSVVFVDLAALADPALLPASVCAALEISPGSDRPLVASIIANVRSRQLLLILDNCEHLLSSAGALVATLLASCPALHVLATSRAPLRIQGEQEFPIDPLPLPEDDALSAEALARNDAVRLFANRARAVHPDFRLGPANAGAVAALCRRLDGLPLAIELAAARSKLYAPHALLEQMTDRLQVLNAGPRDMPARQQTMRDTINWSYDLLAPEEQRLFRRLAVFAGGFTLAAAQTVAGSDLVQTGAHGLAALLDQSLIRRIERDGDAHFTMLETIREFGLAQLAASGEEADIRERHASYFWDRAATVDLHRDDASRQDDRWRTRLMPEQANLRQALTWFAERGDALSLNTMCASLTEHGFILAQFEEGRRWLDRAMANETGVPLATRACIHSEAGWLAVAQGDFAAAASLLDQGVTMARELGDPYLLNGVLQGCGKLAYQQGALVEAEALFAEAEKIARDLPVTSTVRPLRISGTLASLGAVALSAGEVDLAVSRYSEALGLARIPGGARAQTFSLYGLGLIGLREGKPADAAASFLEAMALAWMIQEFEPEITRDGLWTLTRTEPAPWVALKEHRWRGHGRPLP